ncbi:hypothetical protein [Streptomyces chartreusis]|uniref:hypothetical protein n=1 Tax=Streptomyces chartreusis TaxID=1969 RepID=UPI00381CE569
MADNKGDRTALIVRAGMYTAALAAGVTLVLVGHTTPVEASGYVSPFLVVFESRAGSSSRR